MLNMSDDAFDAFDDVDLDDRFLAQVDTLEQTVLTQTQQQQPIAKKARSNGYQPNNAAAHFFHLDESERPAAVAQRCAQAGDADSADLASQWEAALAALEAENARVSPAYVLLSKVVLCLQGIVSCERSRATLIRSSAECSPKRVKQLLCVDSRPLSVYLSNWL